MLKLLVVSMVGFASSLAAAESTKLELDIPEGYYVDAVHRTTSKDTTTTTVMLTYKKLPDVNENTSVTFNTYAVDGVKLQLPQFSNNTVE